jgi:predicted MFS family arabinose efflux permease
MRAHLQRGGHIPFGHALREAREILRNRTVQLSYTTTAVVMAGGFILIPNISAYVQENLGYPRAQLGWLYGGGGVASLIAMQFVGRLVDRHGSFRVGLLGAVMLSATVYVGFIHYPPGFPVLALYVAFMTSAAFRNVSYNTLASRVPQPQWRARFMSAHRGGGRHLHPAHRVPPAAAARGGGAGPRARPSQGERAAERARSIVKSLSGRAERIAS